MSGLTEAHVLCVSVQKEFSKRQSDRLKADLLREIHTPQIECGPSQKARVAYRLWGCQFFIEVSNFTGYEWEGYSSYLGKGEGFPGIGSLPSSWPFTVGLQNVLDPVSVSVI